MITKGKKVLYNDEVWSLAQDDISGNLVKIQKYNGEEFYVNKNEVYNLVNVNVDYSSKGNYILVGGYTGVITNINGEDIDMIIKGQHHTIQKNIIKESYTKGSLLSELEREDKNNLDIKYVYSRIHSTLCTPILNVDNKVSYKRLDNDKIITGDSKFYDVFKKNKKYIKKGDLVFTQNGYEGEVSNISSNEVTVNNITHLKKENITVVYSIGSIIKNYYNTNTFKKGDLVLYKNNPYIVFEVPNKDKIVLMNTLNGTKINVTNLTKNIVKLNKVSKDYRNIEIVETKDNKLYIVVDMTTDYINARINSEYNAISHNNIRDYYTTDNIDVLPKPIEETQQKQDTQDTNKNKFITLRTVTWKNPKPKIKNNKPLELNQYILVDGLELGYKVSCIIDDKIEIQKNKTKKYINKEDVYPLYKTEDNEAKSIRVGNIVLLEKGIFGIITKVLDDNLYKIKDYEKPIKIDEIQEVYTTKKPKINAVKYSCGKVLYKGQTYNEKELENMFKGSKFIYEEIQNTYNDTLIAKEYNVSLDRIKPKEKSIYNKLKTVLYHPLSIQNKRWACLLGESGTGKTQIAVELAKNMGKEYVLYQGNAQVTVDDLKGYRSITTGKYFGSLLRDAVENGKIFILDEIDACNPNTLIALNSLKRDTYQFEDKEVKVHEDFRLIATANSLEMSEEYNARIPMDKATKARFKIIEYNMEAVDLAVRYGLEYIKKIPNIDRLTAREIEDIVIDMKIQEQIDRNNIEGWEV